MKTKPTNQENERPEQAVQEENERPTGHEDTLNKRSTQAEIEVDTDMMEEGGTDVVQVSQQSEETTALLVVPHLWDK